MSHVLVPGFRCERCQHQWAPRVTGSRPPTVCPKCKSPYWDKPRTEAKKRKAV